MHIIRRGTCITIVLTTLFTEYMRKSLISQVVSGRHTYMNLVTGNICGLGGVGSPLMVNAINTSSIVMRGSNVTFADKKTFQSFTVRHLNISLINDVSNCFYLCIWYFL